MRKVLNLALLLFPICIVGMVLPFFSGKSLLNDYIDFHIYGFILSILITGMLFLLINIKKKSLFTGNYLSLSVLIISSYLIFHNLFTSSGSLLNLVYIIAFVTLFFLFQSDRGKHNKLISILIIIICTGEAIYGIGQCFHLFRYSYTVKGSFDNPAGFAALLSMGVPFSISLFSYSPKYKIIGVSTFVIFLCAIALSASRAGIISSIVILLYYLILRFKMLIISNRKTVIVFCFVLFSLLGIYLFFMKQDSATGRMLIWQNTCRMITKNPLWGNGKNSFQANYMGYQADYFAENPESKYVLLADNVSHPFNEYLLLVCEYGLIGFLLLMGIVWIIFRFTPKHFTSHFGAIIALMVFSCFSYPSYYPIVLVISSYSLAGISSFLLPVIQIRYSSLLKGCLSMLLVYGIFFTISSIRFELQWKEVIRLCSLGKSAERINDYRNLYNKWNGNPYFLYNYAVQLNYLQKFEESLQIGAHCLRYLNDYDIQLLLANNYYCLENYQKAKTHYNIALQMCPNRFIPLKQLHKIALSENNYNQAKKIAQIILEKSVKIPSHTVNKIVLEMKQFSENETSD